MAEDEADEGAVVGVGAGVVLSKEIGTGVGLAVGGTFSEEADDGSWSGFICCSSQILNLHPTFIDLIVNLFFMPSCHSNYYLCVILAQSVTFILSRKLIIHDDIGF